MTASAAGSITQSGVEPEHDIAVFPLAIPATATPGAISAVMLLTDNQVHPISVQIVLETARKIEDAHSRSRALAGVVKAMARSGSTDEAFEAARKIEDAFTRSLALVRVVELLAGKHGVGNMAKSAIEEAQQSAEEVTDLQAKSTAFAGVATGLPKLRFYRRARELVDLTNTSVGDKVRAYTAIVREYHIAHQQDEAQSFR